MTQAPHLHFELGAYHKPYKKAVEKADKGSLVSQIWAGDHTLWNPEPDEISNRLGWLDIATKMRDEIGDLAAFAEEINSEGINQVLLLGMGGSSLAPDMFSKIFGEAKGYPKLSVLDSTDPEAVRSLMESHEPAETLYLVSTKSGGTIETLSFFKTFYRQTVKALGEKEAGRHFAAITDPESKLVEIAKKYKFRQTFENDPNIGGRYSALSFFGMVPAALLGADVDEVLSRAENMMAACGGGIRAADNPGAKLGLALAELAKAGRDKVTFISSPTLDPFGDWIEQLIAESTGKSGKGILPVVGEGLADAASYGNDRVFVFIHLGEQVATEAAINELKDNGHPVIQIKWDDNYELGAQFFLWEFATAVAGHGLGIHPFNQPNVVSAKVQARHLMDAYSKNGKLPEMQSDIFSNEILSKFLEGAKPGDYIALQAYVNPSDENRAALQGLRRYLQKEYKLATTLGFGPRFLHSTGQLHKGDRGNGLFIQFITGPSKNDLPIPQDAESPKSAMSYGVLKQAQALGDAQALRNAGRRVLSFQIENNLSEALSTMMDDFE